MIGRKEKIYQKLQSQPQQEWTTSELAEALQLQRSNVSKELNILVREGKVDKTKTRPVRYQLSGEQGRTVAVKKRKSETKSTEEEEVFIFQRIIGNKGSMKTQIEQAKAAILYPPKGLNCLITGQTGTGKTLFAHTMFQFAKAHHLIDQNKKLTVFNCADYANNSELLMSHLFGYTKGAFTGAEETTDGLIQQADGGMLFLDEVHRLPPEGQEMIFYFMDHGCYSRLGEVEKKNYADVRIVCATTDDPNSALLSTFTRRIPIMIQLPSFHERPAKEQIDLLKTMLQLEASRIQRCFKVQEDVAKALIGSVEYGNVGQLKSNVQLLCASGFFNHMSEEVIPLTMDLLTPEIRNGLSNLTANRKLHLAISHQLDGSLLIRPTDDLPQLVEQDAYELPYNLYEIIDCKAAVLKSEGLDQEAINNFITTDINIHLKSFYQKTALAERENKLNDIVDERFINLAKQLKLFLAEEHYYVGDEFIYAMSLHLSALVKRIEDGGAPKQVSSNLLTMVENYPQELYTAQRMKLYLEQYDQFDIPQSELYYLATLLISLKTSAHQGQISILVAAHGNSTASSMVQVVSELLKVDHLYSYDMSLDVEPLLAFQQLKELVQQIDRGSGVLLLVDMGSLTTFTHRLTKETGIEVRTIEMVTTAMVLEAARKTMMDMDLETIYEELCAFKGYSRALPQKKEPVLLADKRSKLILAICATGEGTAQRIKEQLDAQLIDQLIDDVIVKTISVVQMEAEIQKLEKEYHIVAAVGIKDPGHQIPFLPLESFLQGKGEKFNQFLQQVTQGQSWQETEGQKNFSEQETKAYIQSYIEAHYLYLNPNKIVPLLWEYTSFIERRLALTMENGFKMSFILHLAGALERQLKGENLSIQREEQNQLQASEVYVILQEGNNFLQEHLLLQLADSELYYIWQLIDTEKEKMQYRN